MVFENRKIDYRIVPAEHYTGTLHVGKKREYGSGVRELVDLLRTGYLSNTTFTCL